MRKYQECQSLTDIFTSSSPQTTPSRNKHVKKFPLFINPYSTPLSRFHLLLISLRVTSQIKNPFKFSFNDAPERLSLWMFSSAVEAGPFEGTACEALLCWGKRTRGVENRKSPLEKHLRVCYLSVSFIYILWWTIRSPVCSRHKPLEPKRDIVPIPSIWLFWKKRSKRSQDESLDARGRKKSRAFALPVEFPNVDQATPSPVGAVLPQGHHHCCDPIL